MMLNLGVIFVLTGLLGEVISGNRFDRFFDRDFYRSPRRLGSRRVIDDEWIKTVASRLMLLTGVAFAVLGVLGKVIEF